MWRVDRLEAGLASVSWVLTKWRAMGGWWSWEIETWNALLESSGQILWKLWKAERFYKVKVKCEVIEKTSQDVSEGWFQSFFFVSKSCMLFGQNLRGNVKYSFSEVIIQWSNHSVKYSFSEVLIQWSTHSVKYSFSEVLIQWSTRSVKYSFSGGLVQWSTHSVK